MKSIYITSIDAFSGKTALSLVLGKFLMDKGFKVGYMKPLSFQPWIIGDRVADEDAAFVKDTLGISAQPWDLSPIVITTEFLSEQLQATEEQDLMKVVLSKVEEISSGQDVMIYEGGGNLREGYVVDLPPITMAEKLDSKVLAIVAYKDRRHLIDDVLAVKRRIGDDLGGVIINRAPVEATEFITKSAIPFIKNEGIEVFGVIPETKALGTLTLQEVFEVLDAELLTEAYNPDKTIEALMVGAMTAEKALSRFRRQANKAVITGGDRSDIQLAALETSTSCLILTGNLNPSPLVIKQAEDLGVAIFLVPSPTLETVEKVDGLLGKNRIGQRSKFEKFEKLFHQFVDTDRLMKAFSL